MITFNGYVNHGLVRVTQMLHSNTKCLFMYVFLPSFLSPSVSVIDSMTTQITLRNLDEGRLGTLVCQMGPLTSTVEIEVEGESIYHNI